MRGECWYMERNIGWKRSRKSNGEVASFRRLEVLISGNERICSGVGATAVIFMILVVSTKDDVNCTLISGSSTIQQLA